MAEVTPLAYARSAVEGEESLRELHTLVRIAQAEMRTLLYELRPTALTTVPLSNLLQALALSVDGRLEAVLLPRIAQTPTLPADVQVALYRIAQEALQNCVKHAQANTASVELVLEPLFEPPSGELWRGRLRLTVADDGCGFDHAAVARGHGLDSITERAQLIGASCAIRSAPGEGTRVELVWEGEMVRG
jgi:signal transduction histidine kinase